MKVACLGWGSLVWDARDLPLASDWFEDGPHLPLEFSRQSADDRLTLVIDEGAALSQTMWVLLDVWSCAEAVIALARREGTSQGNIGRWPMPDSNFYSHAERIEKWAADREIEAVVWTALSPGMKSSRGVSPTLDELIAHLRSLDDLTRANAAQYVFKAPNQIKARCRQSLETFLSE